MNSESGQRRDTPPPYPSLAWMGHYDDSASHRPRLVASGYPLRWQGVDGQPETWSARWIASGQPVEERGHVVFDRWQGHRVVASGLTGDEAITLSERLEIEQPRCGQRPAVCWQCHGEILVRGLPGEARCRTCPGGGHVWRLSEVYPCPWPASAEAVSPQGQRLLVCRSHATLWAAG
jgi:hypothetical protein